MNLRSNCSQDLEPLVFLTGRWYMCITSSQCHHLCNHLNPLPPSRPLAFPVPQGPLYHPFLPMLPALPDIHPSILHLYSCVASEMFCKQNQKTYSLLGLSFFPLGIIPWSPSTVGCVHGASFSSLSSVCGTGGPQFVTICLEKDIGTNATL